VRVRAVRSASEFGDAELLNRFAARCEEARGRSDVDVRDEQPFSTVWLVSVLAKWPISLGMGEVCERIVATIAFSLCRQLSFSSKSETRLPESVVLLFNPCEGAHD
jgi:hypothetical protein